MKLSIAALLIGAASAFMAPQQPAQQSATALAMSGVERNPNFAKLAGGYLFPEIGRRRTAYLEKNPEMADRIISLGIGDTTRECSFWRFFSADDTVGNKLSGERTHHHVTNCGKFCLTKEGLDTHELEIAFVIHVGFAKDRRFRAIYCSIFCIIYHVLDIIGGRFHHTIELGKT